MAGNKDAPAHRISKLKPTQQEQESTARLNTSQYCNTIMLKYWYIRLEVMRNRAKQKTAHTHTILSLSTALAVEVECNLFNLHCFVSLPTCTNRVPKKTQKHVTYLEHMV